MDWQQFVQQLPGIAYQLIREPNGRFRFTFLSDSVVDLLGFEVAPLLEDAEPLFNAIHPDDVENVISSSVLAAEQGLEWHYPFRFIRPDGTLLWLDAHDSGRARDDGTLEWSGYIVEATHRKQLEFDLRSSEKRFRSLVEHANDIIFTLDRNGIIDYLSPNLERHLGYQRTSSLQKSFEHFVHPDDVGACHAFIQALFSDHSPVSDIEFRVRHQNGDWRWYACRASRIDDQDGQHPYLLGIARDITEQREQREKLARMARHDMLTQLLNRNHFDEHFARVLQHCAAQQRCLAILFVDLDHFKPVNDEHGHSIGDQMLVHVARRLKSCLRDTDLACRNGGDEFLVLAHDFIDLAQAEEVAQTIAARIHDELEKPFAIETKQLQISASIGIALYPAHGATVDALVNCADSAMYQAKKAGRKQTVSAQLKSK